MTAWATKRAQAWERCQQALATVAATDPDAFVQVASAVDGLNNRDAWDAINDWIARQPRSFARGSGVSAAIWAERKRLRRDRVPDKPDGCERERPWTEL